MPHWVRGRTVLLVVASLGLVGLSGCNPKKPERPCFCVDVREADMPVMLNSPPGVKLPPGRAVTMTEKEATQASSSSSSYNVGNVQVTQTTSTFAKQQSSLPIVKQLRSETNRTDRFFQATETTFTHFRSDFVGFGASASEQSTTLTVQGDIR
jgi:hypothetical protein